MANEIDLLSVLRGIHRTPTSEGPLESLRVIVTPKEETTGPETERRVLSVLRRRTNMTPPKGS